MAEPHEMYQCQTVNCGFIYNPDKADRKDTEQTTYLAKYALTSCVKNINWSTKKTF